MLNRNLLQLHSLFHRRVEESNLISKYQTVAAPTNQNEIQNVSSSVHAEISDESDCVKAKANYSFPFL